EKYSDPHTQKLLDIATALDPRFKLDYVSEDNKISVKAILKNEMTSIALQSPSTTAPSAQPSPPFEGKKRKTLGNGCASAVLRFRDEGVFKLWNYTIDNKTVGSRLSIDVHETDKFVLGFLGTVITIPLV
ncbi:putative zinc finger BED domain-containing protein 1-like, partial [Triplophysa rosa]